MFSVRFRFALGLLVGYGMILPAPNQVKQIPRSERLVRCFQLAKHRPSHGLLVAAVVNCKLLRVPEALNVATENSNAKRMEGGNLRRFFFAAAQ